jgi:hypothetical protein
LGGEFQHKFSPFCEIQFNYLKLIYNNYMTVNPGVKVGSARLPGSKSGRCIIRIYSEFFNYSDPKTLIHWARLEMIGMS